MNSKQVKGLAVISIADGAKLGVIESASLDIASKCIVGFAVAPSDGAGEPQFVTCADIHALGPDALTLDDASKMSGAQTKPEGSEFVDLSELLKSKVVTEGGTFVGQVTCIEFGLDSYRLTQIAVSSGFMRGNDTIHADDILNVAGELVVVADAVCGAEAGGQVQAVAVA